MEDKKGNVVLPPHLGKKQANCCQHDVLISLNSDKVAACSETERERKNIAFQYFTSARKQEILTNLAIHYYNSEIYCAKENHSNEY